MYWGSIVAPWLPGASEQERTEVTEVLHSEKYCDQPSAAVHKRVQGKCPDGLDQNTILPTIKLAKYSASFKD